MSLDIFPVVDTEGRLFSPVEQASMLAKYSRSSESMRVIAAKSDEAKAAAFQEKYVVAYGHSCYDKETEVLTEEGFVPWPEITGSERLASLNPVTGKMEYLVPVRIIREQYLGLMYRVLTKRLDLMVTPNHKMWVWLKGNTRQRSNPKYELIPARDLTGKPVAYQIGGDWDGPEPDTLSVGARQVDASSLLALIGFFIGDGYHDVRYYSAVLFHLKKQRKITYLSTLCEACGFELVLHKNNKFYVKGEGIGTFFEQCYNDVREKQIPKNILQFGPGSLRSLFEGLMHSDGSYGKVNDLTYSTSSKQLADQIAVLSLKLGYATWTTAGTRTASSKRVYVISINRSKNRPEVNKVSYHTQDSWIPYDGLVYCAELPANHILYVRRNGRGAWSGNSVSELCTIPVAFEGVSIVASKILESWDRPGVSEKSTRRQVFTRDSFVGRDYVDESVLPLVDEAYDTYEKLLPEVTEYVAQRDGVDKDKQQAKDTAFDLLRGLLPAGTGTNLAVVAYPRDIASMISKLTGSQNPEFVTIGNSLKEAVKDIGGPLIRHAEPDEWGNSFYQPLDTSNTWRGRKDPFVSITWGESTPCDTDTLAFNTCTPSLFNALMDSRPPKHDIPDVFRRIRLRMDVLMDYGGYRDIQRHRRCNRSAFALTPSYGYVVPSGLLGTRFEEAYRTPLDKFVKTDICDVELGQYAVPLAFLHRSSFEMDLQEFYYMIELRTQPGGHESYRRIMYEAYKKASNTHPQLMQWCRACPPDQMVVKAESRGTAQSANFALIYGTKAR